MKQKRIPSQTILRFVGVVLGLVSILGGIAAFVRAGQPERYLVSAIVMICSGVFWLICSNFKKFNLTREQYTILLWVLLLGLVFGLFNTYFGCGNECLCHRQYGYPGYWLRTSNCMGGSVKPTSWQVIKNDWHINFPSLAADVVFWSGAGLIISIFWKRIH
jgi:hypothetical protein